MNRRGDIVVGWLVRLILFLAVLGVIAFEAGAVIVAKVNVDGTAETAAQDAALSYGRSRDVNVACTDAEAAARRGDAAVKTCSVSQDGQFVTVTIEKTAKTIIIQHIGPLKKFRIARATHTIKVT